MKTILVFLFFLFLQDFVVANEAVRGVSLMGVRLGDKKSTIQLDKTCKNNQKKVELSYGYIITCSIKKNNNKTSFQYDFDRSEKLLRYSFSLETDDVNEYNSYVSKTRATNQKPDYSKKMVYESSPGEIDYNCWGDCSVNESMARCVPGAIRDDYMPLCAEVSMGVYDGKYILNHILQDGPATKIASKNTLINNGKDEVIGACDHIYAGKELSYSGCFFGAPDNFVVQGFSPRSQRVTIRGKNDRQCTKEISCYDVSR